MKRSGALAAAVAGLLLIPAGASAADPPPGAQISDNLDYIRTVADTRQVVEGKFDEVRGKDVLVLTGRFGFKTLDVSDPTNPKPLDSFLPADLNEGGYWQNEDMELDTRRKLIIGALDPRHTDLGATNASPCPPGGSVNNPNCKAGFYVISYADPSNLKQVGDFVDLPAGHTSSCIQKCKYIWTGGPARTTNPELRWLGPILGPTQPAPWTAPRLVGDGRPIWVTDLSDPKRPKVSDEPIDLWRNDGYTDYSHDVDEDENGIAWISGRGGIRGYATSGYHRDPYQNRTRKATPLEPILVAGGGVAGTAQTVMLMHNSGRPTDGSVRASGVKKGNVLVGTEEDFTGPCENSGKIVLSDLSDSWGGEPAQHSTLDDPYRMEPLDTFHPHIDTPENDTNPAGGCSAHYFEIEGSMLGAGWYGQGLRLLDISNARDVRQVGYYRVTGTTPGSGENPSSNSWDMEFYDSGRRNKHGARYAYLFDMSRGVEILRLDRGTGYSSKMKSVTAPNQKRDRFAAKPVGGLSASTAADGSVSYICPLFL